MNDWQVPYGYNEISTVDGIIQPSTVHVTNTGLSRFFQKYLLQKAISQFEWKIPKHWNKDYFLFVLYLYGYISVINTDKFGVICQQCSLRGYDVFYQPTHAVIVNPLIRRTMEPRIGTQCTLLKLQPSYTGIYDLVSYYGDQMALAAQSFGVNTLNSKLSYLFLAEDQKLAKSMRKLYDQMASGEPAVFADRKLFNTETGQDNYRLEQITGTDIHLIQGLLDVLTQLEIMFDQVVGIPNVSTTRRERELTSELAANQINTRSLADTWLERLKQSCADAREMFGIELNVDWREVSEGLPNNAGNVSLQPDAV